LEYPIDHVAIAVRSIDTARRTFEHMAGVVGGVVEAVDSQGVRVLFIGSGAGRIELLEPSRPDSAVARFLEKRGPGLHHIAYRVPDLEAALEQLATDGFELIDRVPRPGAGGHRVAFLHPRSTDGVLVELVGD
jgi:methylmalonyl-CoA/ethylmalonyl-CoA epimerase